MLATVLTTLAPYFSKLEGKHDLLFPLQGSGVIRDRYRHGLYRQILGVLSLQESEDLKRRNSATTV